MASPLEDFRRYQSIIQSVLGDSSAPSINSEDAMSVQIERGIILRDALIDPASQDQSIIQRLLEISNSSRLPELKVIDASGHSRPVYRALLVYSWLLAFRQLYETLPRSQFGRWEESLRAWCDLLESELTRIDWPAGPIPAKMGSNATRAVWAALTLSVAGKVFVRDAWTDLAADTFGKLSQRQLDNGALLQATADDSIETLGYHEVVTLHAAASYSVQSEDRTIAAMVARASVHHAREIQADHSTNQPWALFAFIWNPATRPIADQLLHAASTQLDGVSLILLADALYCLRLFTGNNS